MQRSKNIATLESDKLEPIALDYKKKQEMQKTIISKGDE